MSSPYLAQPHLAQPHVAQPHLAQPYLAQQPSNAAPINPVARVNQIDYWLGSFVIVTPLALTIAFLAHRKHRTAVLQRQVALLEKLWKINTHERSS